MEADCLSVLMALHQSTGHGDPGALRGDHGQPLGRNPPVRAPIEVLQRDLHAIDRNPAPHWKVKC